MTAETLTFWIALAFYGLSTFAFILGFIGRSAKLFSAGQGAASVGLPLQTLSIALRWAHSEATPFITVAESITLGVWVVVLLFLIVQFSTAKVRPLGVLVMPVAFILIGWAGMLRTAPAAQQQAPALQSGWLWVHIVGASTGFAAVLIAAGLGLMYLLKQSGRRVADMLPAPPVLDELSYRFVVGGFTLYGVMIVSGSFWADQAKGTFWAWDPVEVWSLVSWLVYGIYLHLRITMGWRGRRLAIYSLAAVVLMIVSYWGIPFSMETFHAGFRIPH
jgi:cytochrome c-type biogenesis protein CcsB